MNNPPIKNWAIIDSPLIKNAMGYNLTLIIYTFAAIYYMI